MPEVEGTGEPIYLEFVDALGLYAAIISGRTTGVCSLPLLGEPASP